MKPFKKGRTWYVEFDRIHEGRRYRFRHATATGNHGKAVAMDRMLQRLVEDRRWDILEMLARGEYALPDLFALYEAGKLHEARTASELRRVDVVLPQFVAEAESEHTAAGRRHVGRKVLALKVDATLRDLPELVGLLRGRLMGKRETA